MDDISNIEIVEDRKRTLGDRPRLTERFTNEEFKNRTRLSKRAFDDLLLEITNVVPLSKKSWGLSLEEKLFITLRFYATNCLQSSVGDFIEIYKGTVSRVIHEITDALCQLRGTCMDYVVRLIVDYDEWFL